MHSTIVDISEPRCEVIQRSLTTTLDTVGRVMRPKQQHCFTFIKLTVVLCSMHMDYFLSATFIHALDSPTKFSCTVVISIESHDFPEVGASLPSKRARENDEGLLGLFRPFHLFHRFDPTTHRCVMHDAMSSVHTWARECPREHTLVHETSRLA